MVKQKVTFLLLIVFMLFPLFSIQEANAQSDKQRIYDFAKILTDNEVANLEKLAAKYSEKRETDFIILTMDDPEQDIETYMGDFYDENGLGYNKEHGNTAIIALNMDEKRRDVLLAGFGKAEKYLDPDKLTTIREKVTPSLSEGDYEQAFTSFIKLSAKYMTFKPGTNPANPLYNTWVQLGLSIAIAGAIVWVLARNPGMKVTTNAATYQDEGQTKINHKKDRYIRTTVTKKRKPKPKSNSGGSGGGFRGGSTGGGRSFSGSRGKF